MSRTKRVLLWVMGGFYILNGLNHFFNADAYIAINWVRLPFQVVLIAWAYWYVKPDVPAPVVSPS